TRSRPFAARDCSDDDRVAAGFLRKWSLDRISQAISHPLFCGYSFEMPLSRPANSVIVDVDNTWKVYQTGSVKVEALRGVNLAVKRGEMIAVIGPSGGGKTTLLNCVSGLHDLSKVRVSVDATDLPRISVEP